MESVNAKLSIKNEVMSIHSILSHNKLILPMTWQSSLFPKIGIYAAKEYEDRRVKYKQHGSTLSISTNIRQRS